MTLNAHLAKEDTKKASSILTTPTAVANGPCIDIGEGVGVRERLCELKLFVLRTEPIRL